MADTRTWQTYAEGSFKTLKGNTVNLKIQKLQDDEITSPYTITCPASQPLIIEWGETEKHEPVCSSAATLKVLSTEFQMFMPLYTVETGSVRLLVYKNGSLYWSGYMDTEFYEEPFNLNKNYEVKITFTDLGVLKRADFDLDGVPTLRSIIDTALERSGVQYTDIVENISGKWIQYSSQSGKIKYFQFDTISTGSTYRGNKEVTFSQRVRIVTTDKYNNGRGSVEIFSGNTQVASYDIGTDDPAPKDVYLDAGTYTVYFSYLTGNNKVIHVGFDCYSASEELLQDNILENISIQSADFYDEDEEPSKWYDVLEAILQPLALRLIIRNSKVYIYDINYLCDSADKSRQSFSFARDDQNIEMDSVYQKIKVTFSPYSVKTVLTEDFDITEKDYYDEAQLLDGDANYDEIGVDRFADIEDDDNEDETQKRTLYYNLPVKGLCMMKGAEEFYAYMFRGAMYRKSDSELLINHRNQSDYYGLLHIGSAPQGESIMYDSTQWIPYFPALRSIPQGKTYTLHLDLSTYFSATGFPGKVDITKNYYPTASKTTLGCEALGGADWFAFIRISLVGVDGKTYHLNQYSYDYSADYNKEYTWSESETFPVLFLPLNNAYGFSCDWVKNTFDFPTPPVAGYIRLEVMDQYGAYIPSSWSSPTEEELENFASNAIVWWLMKAPEMYLHLEGDEEKSIELDDIETSKEANLFAEEELSIDTKCGSSRHLSPISRGIYILKEDALPMSEGWDTSNNFHPHQYINRAGKSDTPESLLIRTLMAQHITRHLKLTGSVDTIDCDLQAMRCNDIQDKDFLVTAESIDLHDDLSSLTLVEISPDADADTIDYVSEETKYVDARPRAQRLRDNNLALVKKEARILY